MEPEVSLPHLQQPVTCFYSDPDQSSQCPHPTTWRSSLILSSYLPFGLSSGFFSPSGFPTKTLYAPLLSHLHATCPAPLILVDTSSYEFHLQVFRYHSSGITVQVSQFRYHSSGITVQVSQFRYQNSGITVHTSDMVLLTLRLLMSYIYEAHILDVSRSHTTTQHTR